MKEEFDKKVFNGEDFQIYIARIMGIVISMWVKYYIYNIYITVYVSIFPFSNVFGNVSGKLLWWQGSSSSPGKSSSSYQSPACFLLATRDSYFSLLYISFRVFPCFASHPREAVLTCSCFLSSRSWHAFQSWLASSHILNKSLRPAALTAYSETPTGIWAPVLSCLTKASHSFLWVIPWRFGCNQVLWSVGLKLFSSPEGYFILMPRVFYS